MVAVDDVSGQYFFIGWNALFLVLAVTFLLTARYTEPGLLHTNPTLGSMTDREWHGMIKRELHNQLAVLYPVDATSSLITYSRDSLCPSRCFELNGQQLHDAGSQQWHCA